MTHRQELEEAKDRLEGAYKLVAEEELASRIHEVEKAQKQDKHSRSWQLINEISGRRTSRKGQLKGTSQLKRVKNWIEQLQRLLGAPQEIDNEDEDIPPILNDLNIKLVLSTWRNTSKPRNPSQREKVAVKMR